ncbi:MAG: BREX-6 system phosphatase PglZ [Deltaproteobacteria bacterium]|nr:MAG: BREX-6 system phosphatase PglZ [Deltaproteobacteria bacterium]
MTSLGPVSSFLEADLRSWVQRHGIVVWLDLDGHYTAFVDRLIQARAAGELPYAVHAFRGSHLELLLELDRIAGGVERKPLVLHLPGFNEETVRLTPLLELYLAGVRYRKKLDTLITEAAGGRVDPDEIVAFKKGGGVTLAGADTWLAARLQLSQGGDLLPQLQLMGLSPVVDDLIEGGKIAQMARDPAAQEVLWSFFTAQAGLTEAWRLQALPAGNPRASDLAFAVSSWALTVEYVNDLQRPPADPSLAGRTELPGVVVQNCTALADFLRQHREDFYLRTADETEGWLVDEVEVARAQDLGKIDTFRFEEDQVLHAALALIAQEQWELPQTWAQARAKEGSFWLRQQPARRSAWQLIADMVELGLAITEAGPHLGATTHDEVLARYTSVGAAVDRAHRRLEQHRTALLDPQLPEFETLRARLDGLRVAWRTWADDWSRDFNALCRRVGFLPGPALLQRTLFDDVVRPMTQKAGKTALFMVDALRYEMAGELFEAIEGAAMTQVHLKARYAELPSVTEVGMNVLAPVSRNGKLSPTVREGKFCGWSTGEYRVRDPETRKRTMWDRVGGSACPWFELAEVLDHDTSGLKQRIKNAELVIVHSLEIDNAGEKGVGRVVFDNAIQQLRSALHLLREAGIKRFVITSDHGFLLHDDSAPKAIDRGRKIDPKRRHMITEVATDHPNEVRVSLSELGYEGVEGLHVVFPASTAVFNVGQKKHSFVHGGNSLQERVIPVLTVEHRSKAGGETGRYQVKAAAREGVANMHCLSASVEFLEQGQLGFGGTSQVELALRVIDGEGVSVELCHVRDGAELRGGAIVAKVGRDFEVFFKLTAQVEQRVRVALHHPGGVIEVAAHEVEQRFDVLAIPLPAEEGTEGDDRVPKPPPAERPTSDKGWLDAFEGGTRQFLEHLAAHGTVTETELGTMLGSPRKARALARQIEAIAAKVPFGIKISNVAGVKHYVREGSSS